MELSYVDRDYADKSKGRAYVKKDAGFTVRIGPKYQGGTALQNFGTKSEATDYAAAYNTYHFDTPGYQFKHECQHDVYYCTAPSGAEYRTGYNGCGLYRWHKFDKNWQQVRGDMQFSYKSNGLMAIAVSKLEGN